MEPPVAHHGPTHVPRAIVGPIDMSDRIGYGYNIDVSKGTHKKRVIAYLESIGYTVYGVARTTNDLVEMRDQLTYRKDPPYFVQVHVLSPKDYKELLAQSKQGYLYTGEKESHVVMIKERLR